MRQKLSLSYPHTQHAAVEQGWKPHKHPAEEGDRAEAAPLVRAETTSGRLEDYLLPVVVPWEVFSSPLSFLATSGCVGTLPFLGLVASFPQPAL